jgi:hypothetical protein
MRTLVGSAVLIVAACMVVAFFPTNAKADCAVGCWEVYSTINYQCCGSCAPGDYDCNSYCNAVAAAAGNQCIQSCNSSTWYPCWSNECVCDQYGTMLWCDPSMRTIYGS